MTGSSSSFKTLPQLAKPPSCSGQFLLLLSVISDCITNLHPYTAYRLCITKPSLVLVQVIQSSLKLPRLANIFNQHARDEAGEDMATNQPAIRKETGTQGAVLLACTVLFNGFVPKMTVKAAEDILNIC
ncbi:hypothetical protein YC2023_000920 [Brassica napus]